MNRSALGGRAWPVAADGYHVPFHDFSTNDGHPKSADHFHKIGAYSGPNVLGEDSHHYPKNTLDSSYNGTFQWFTSDGQ